MHIVTALNYGKPPTNRKPQPMKIARDRPIPPPRASRNPVTDQGGMECYSALLLEFREWCELRGISFRRGMMRAVGHYMKRTRKA